MMLIVTNIIIYLCLFYTKATIVFSLQQMHKQHKVKGIEGGVGC